MKMLLKNATIVSGGISEKKDILIENGKISAIENQINDEVCAVIECDGLHILPGLIDMHVHLREPGLEGKEDIESGSKAAVAGGFTQVACMPNTVPVNDNAIVTTYIKYRADKVGLCKVHPIGAITKGEEGKSLSDIGKMAQAGAVALSDDGKSVMDSYIMRLGMEYGNDFGLKCLCHCEDANLVDGGVVNEGKNSTITGIKGSIRAVEDIMISREILLSQSLDIPVHICHVTTYSGVDLIRDAKKRGIKVTAETCPHYFILTDDAILSYDTNTKVNPPLREEIDRQAIVAGILDGTLDCIATDHAPHTIKDKSVEYQFAAFGFTGLESSFGLSYTYLVKNGIISIEKLVELMSTKPAEILNLEGGKIEVGEIADLTIVNLDECYKIDKSKFYSKGKNTPFDNYEVYGKIKYTIVDGVVKYNDREGII